MDYSKIYEDVEQSIVNVVVLDGKNIKSTASGAIVDNGKRVLTCAHCCNTDFPTCIFDKNSNSFIESRIVFFDQTIDIAIIEVSNVIGKPLHITNSSDVKIGNEVLTVGFPYNFMCEKTLTVGNIAAFENDLIKINASVNDGNSGGPLLNIKGEIIGVVNAKLGRLSTFLESIESMDSKVRMRIADVDPIVVVKQMIREMQLNINLGIGYAIPSEKIISACAFSLLAE